jgi:hypothetical protein
MGLAPFFEHARQGAAQVLRDMDDGIFKRRLGEVVLALVFDTQAATSVEGLAALDMAARLIARLSPTRSRLSKRRSRSSKIARAWSGVSPLCSASSTMRVATLACG